MNYLENKIKEDLEQDKELNKLYKELNRYTPLDVRRHKVMIKINKLIESKTKEYEAMFMRDKVSFDELKKEMSSEDIEICAFSTDIIVRLVSLVNFYSKQVDDITGKYVLDGRVMLYDKLKEAGEGARDVLRFLNTLSDDYKNDVADNDNQFRIMVESCYKTIRKPKKQQ